jgi:GMP synthase (glutamine-hydrolysing)
VRPVLAIRHHQPHQLGVAGEVFDELSVPYRYLDAWEERDWPALDDLAGLIVLGGEMNADEVDRHPFLARERDLMRLAVERDVPILGFCLGAQLLARALGAAVPRSPTPELGFHPVRLTEAGRSDPVLAPLGLAPRVFQWHVDTFDLPEEAVLISESDDVPHQAFRVGRSAYAVQFHLEVTEAGIAAWCERWAGDIREHWGTTPEAVMAEVQEYHPAQRTAARGAFRAFAELLER